MIGRAYRSVGLLVLLSVLVTIIAVIVHHLSRLPGAYTWLEPLRTLRSVLEQPHFLSVLALVFLAGRYRLRGSWTFELPPGERLSKTQVLRSVGLGVLLAIADRLVFARHTALDGIALALLVSLVSFSPTLPAAGRVAKETAVAAFVFVCICYSFTIFKALTFADRGTYDREILELENAIFGAYPHRVLAAWSAESPWIIELCDWVYFQFFAHMALVTTLLVGMRRARMRVEYMGALALCYLIGGPLYHLLPAAGPIYFDPKPFRHLFEDPTLLTNPVRSWLYTNTGEVLARKATTVQTWGYIACMPSLHIAQEVVMLWYARRSRVALAASVWFTGTTMLAVVVLGWHYPTDVVGGILVAAIAIFVAHKARGSMLPAAVMPPEDAPLPARPPLRELATNARKLSRIEVA